MLLVAEGFDWVEAGSFHGGPDAEGEADADRDDADHDGGAGAGQQQRDDVAAEDVGASQCAAEGGRSFEAMSIS